MISKIITGKSFGRLCEYLCKDDIRATVLDNEGVRGYDHKLMGQDFEEQARQNPAVKSPAIHVILSYYPGEQISDEKMEQIAKEYLEQLCIKDTQYVIVRHNDRSHPHTHIVINKVGNDGKTIKDNWIGLRGKKAAQQLTIKHTLQQAQKKNLELTNLKALNEYEATRYKIYQTIRDVLPKSKDLDELKSKLEKQGIGMVYKYKSGSNEIQGVSFAYGKFKYKGSEIDRKLSYRNLEKLVQMQLQRQQQKTQILKPSKRLRPLLEQYRSKEQNLLSEILKPEQTFIYTPKELMQKKKKKKQSFGHHL